MGLPLIAHGKVIGYLSLGSDQPNTFNRMQGETAMAFANQAAIAIENTRLFEETSRRAHEFKTLYETTRDISMQQNSDLLLQMIVERAIELLHSKNGGLYLYDAEQQELELSLFSQTEPLKGTRLKLGEGDAGRVALTREPLIIDDYQTWEGRSTQYNGIPLRAVLQVPMLYSGELIGVLTVDEYGEFRTHLYPGRRQLVIAICCARRQRIAQCKSLRADRRRVEELEAMTQISSTLRLATKRAEMLPIVSLYVLAHSHK